MDTDNRKFASQGEAMEWLLAEVDDPCTDNFRFAWCDDELGLRLYDAAIESGCCGSADYRVEIGGREAMIGCNYGH